ncbi:MAG: hypothetical protein HUU54_02055 [Ignavibacteriaceae bacterium]|nr:hypothetical protein [Ignavibacteriaceae bacterium]
MRKKPNLVSTGLSLVDKAWGGFYKGGTYILIGPRKSGRTLISLQYAMEGVKKKEVTLFFTAMRPKDLMIHASSIEFDLQAAMNQNLVIVVRVAPPVEMYDADNPDEFLVEYLNDIVTVVDQYHPDRLVFDELTPFVSFENLGLLQQTFLSTLEAIEEKNVTSLLVLSEPATSFAQTIVDSMAQYSTAIIYLQKKSEDNPQQGGRATITPNIGHTEGQYFSDYFIEPYHGVKFMFENDKAAETEQAQTAQQPAAPPQQQIYAPPSMSSKSSSKYKPLTNVDSTAPQMSFPNVYDLNEFTLILNNQIALFKSTGQGFALISMKLDPIAVSQNIINIPQLQNAVRLSTDKKDKICVVNDKILVLMGKGDEKSLGILVSKMKSNLPNSDPVYVTRVMQYLYAFTYEVSDNTENAETILSEILEDEHIG